jgi:hypothetical protein
MVITSLLGWPDSGTYLVRATTVCRARIVSPISSRTLWRSSLRAGDSTGQPVLIRCFGSTQGRPYADLDVSEGDAIARNGVVREWRRILARAGKRREHRGRPSVPRARALVVEHDLGGWHRQEPTHLKEEREARDWRHRHAHRCTLRHRPDGTHRPAPESVSIVRRCGCATRVAASRRGVAQLKHRPRPTGTPVYIYRHIGRFRSSSRAPE